MNAVDWLRSRQEQQEWAYWLAFAGYKPSDRSWENRIYLVYLVIFFTVWFFITLTLLAVGGAEILQRLDPISPIRAALFLGLIFITVWCVSNIYKALKRSPAIFSEQDALLLCQMPVDHRSLVIRWMFMPWLKSAVPFWLAAITLGFSVAEIVLPEVTTVAGYLEYAWYGLRAWMVIIPLHLVVYAAQWIAGIVRLHKDREQHWPGYLLLAGTSLFLVSLVIGFAAGRLGFPGSAGTGIDVLAFSSGVNFITGNLLPLLLFGWALAGSLLALLYKLSGSFNLSRAAQETILAEKLSSARQYGLTSYADDLETQQRLRHPRVSTLRPLFPGAGTFIWKEVLQVQRTFKLSSFFVWLYVFFLMLIVPFIPDLFSRLFIVAIWVIQLGQVSVVRLRDDLSHWVLVRQLPIARNKMLAAELGSAYMTSIIVSALGLIAGSLAGRMPVDPFVFLLPGIIAGIAGMSALGIIRRSRSEQLFNDSVPGISEMGVIIGLFFALIPVSIVYLMAGTFGLILAILASIGLGILSVNLAKNSFRFIDRN